MPERPSVLFFSEDSLIRFPLSHVFNRDGSSRKFSPHYQSFFICISKERWQEKKIPAHLGAIFDTINSLFTAARDHEEGISALIEKILVDIIELKFLVEYIEESGETEHDVGIDFEIDRAILNSFYNLDLSEFRVYQAVSRLYPQEWKESERRIGTDVHVFSSGEIETLLLPALNLLEEKIDLNQEIMYQGDNVLGEDERKELEVFIRSTRNFLVHEKKPIVAITF